MTVGTTPTESGTVAPSIDPTAEHVEGRQALRAARRQRRRIAIGCALVVALCLAVTLVIVGIARDRTTGGPQTVVPGVLTGSHQVDLPTAAHHPPTESHGAPAPTGG
ncbi:MAG TPA: hypothetical protein VMQ59_01920 [Acidimicrobiales bacterium]|jgi:hypothetical protein|nr:hypothetical protein [Acidimicrobiales bacterium]